MFYEVFIPSAGGEDFDVTFTVEADNWMAALKSGLLRTGEGEDAIRNVMCDIKEDNSIHVTDATTRRVFVLKEIGESVDVSAEIPVNPDPPPSLSEGTRPGVGADASMATVKMEAPDYDKIAQERQQVQPPSLSHETTSPGFADPHPSTLRKSSPLPAISRDPQPVAASAPVVEPQAAQPSVVVQPQAPVQPQAQPSVVVQPQAPAKPSVVVEPQAPAQPSVVVQPQAPVVQPQEPAPSVVIQPQAPAQPSIVVQPQAAQPVDLQPAIPVAQESHDLSESSWTADDASRLRIGSSTFEALQRDEPEAHVIREKRIPTGQREAVPIGRTEERVSDNILEEVFLEINRIHEGEMSMEQVVNYVMDLAMEKVSAEAGSIMFADVNGLELYFATARGPKAHDVMNFRVPMGKGIVGFCAREGVSLAISDAENDPRFYQAISDALGYPTKSLCCAPIQFEGRVYGAIELLNKNNQHFSSTEVNVLTYIGRQLAQFVHDLIMAREKL